MPLSVLLTRAWPAEAEAVARERFGAMLNPDDTPLAADALAAALRDVDILCPTIGDRIDAAMLVRPDRRTRAICNYGAGTDHLDVEACRRAGIVVTNTPDVLTEATAELAITLMLMVLRRAGEGERELRAGRWTGWRPTHMIGGQASGRTLGLVGFGRIARATAAKARGLGMDILYHGRRRADMAVEAEIGARFVPDLDALLAATDIVSLHVPGGAATAGLIGPAELARMKRDAVLVNTARGTVVDEEALAAALHAGRIGGAGLDVFADEPRISPALLAAPNLVALPHLGSATREARVAMGMRTLANVAAIVEGTEPPDRIA